MGGGGAALVLGLLLGRSFGVDPARVSLVVSLLVVLVMTYGHVWNVVEPVARVHRFLLLAWLLAAVLGAVAIWRLGSEAIGRVTTGVTALLAILVVLNVVPIIGFATQTYGEATTSGGAAQGADASASGIGRDVWFIVPDRYGGTDALREGFGFDNEPFLDALRERGFAVADDASANYLKTAFSLGSSLNLELLDMDRLRSEASADDDWGPLVRLLGGSHELERFFHGLGYRYVHLGSRQGPTTRNEAADVNLVYGDATEFSAVLVDTTILVALERVLPSPVSTGSLELLAGQTRFQLSTMHDLADDPQRDFVVAHLLLPHPPYAWNADGTRVTPEQSASRTIDEQYIEQLEFTNRSLLALVDRLQSADADTRPIIVIGSDEGPYPERYLADEEGFRWPEATDDELLRKFSILIAVDVPGVDRAGLDRAGFSDDLTPANLWRVVLNAGFGTDYEMLPNTNWIFLDGRHLYEQTEVTDRVRAGLGRSSR